MTSRPLLVVGAGYTGERLALRAAAEREVTATTRNPERAARLRAHGVRAVSWSEGDHIDALAIGPDVDVVYSVPPGDPPIAPTELAARCGRLVYLSSTSAYGDHRGQTIDEDSQRRPTSPAGRARKAIEDELLQSQHGVCVVRIVGIYGPGRTLDRYIAGGRYKLVDGGAKLTNRIHVDDLATIVLAVLDRGTAGEAYIAADGNPVRVKELVDWLVRHRGIERPQEVSLEEYRAQRGDNAAERWANSYTASNDKILTQLAVTLQYPNVFDGYAAIFGVAR